MKDNVKVHKITTAKLQPVPEHITDQYGCPCYGCNGTAWMTSFNELESPLKKRTTVCVGYQCDACGCLILKEYLKEGDAQYTVFGQIEVSE